MGDIDVDINNITEKIIACAIEVHKNLGPGLLESVYERALCYEFQANDIRYDCQIAIPIIYKGLNLGDYRLDLLVEDEVIVELKAVDRIEPVFDAQLLTYLKVTGKKVGLIINFNTPALKDGIKRMIL
ncbi:MAG TPA: GxxExxY protein [Spirochaetota bacterium]|nr:GxxExxY protein [Spirochaetota bacterium]HPI90862.1 GxxExxY protein [Spirochaetota bacterium]HPR49940.1 GxxExxY protein [Spirochaetota bacterium]